MITYYNVKIITFTWLRSKDIEKINYNKNHKNKQTYSPNLRIQLRNYSKINPRGFIECRNNIKNRREGGEHERWESGWN